MRECFEEAGLLLVADSNGNMIEAQRAASMTHRRAGSFVELLEEENLYVPADALAYFGHWVTPAGRTRRFDTRFFAALAPEGQVGAHDRNETVHYQWITPSDALARQRRGEIELVDVTRHILADLQRFADPRAAFAWARDLDEIETNRGCRAQGKDGLRYFRRADPQYFEIHWSDPQETGETTYDLVPGVPKRLDRYVTRLTAPNPGMMTGPGTNTYLVGQGDLAVIDPGPLLAEHLDRILQFAPIRWIFCTHTHMDHSPAAAALKAATGAQVLGRPAPAGQDSSFSPERILSHNERVAIGGVHLRAIHTPGHASNHLCYLLEETGMLFTGDHVMQGSTVVINPPDGDMHAYLRSLEELVALDAAILAPGHGYLIGEPRKELRRLHAHRMARERKVIRSLRALGDASPGELLPLVYDDVAAHLHGVAMRSLTAHLHKLVQDGVVAFEVDRFRCCSA